jgi:Uncharacterized protein conserved in bacteria (DUF2188)
MSDGFVHTVHKNGAWINVIEGGAQVDGSFATREEAVGFGRDEAIDRKTEHVIHDMDGAIGERNSYGNDPPTRPG